MIGRDETQMNAMSNTRNVQPPIPVTIVTGFLGSGKTTLINQILREERGRNIAVIENEFGEAGVDSDLLIDTEGLIVEINNGCVCCTVSSDLARMLGQLADRRKQGLACFERVIIETTGLASPPAVAQAFFADPKVGAEFAIDTVVTVVDAMHASYQLANHPEAHAHVRFADQILLSKCDAVSPEEVRALTTALQAINPDAPIQPALFGLTASHSILDIGSFILHDKLAIDPYFLDPVSRPHDHAVSSFVYRSRRPFARNRLERFLGSVCRMYGTKLWRCKGILHVEDAAQRIAFQGVHTTSGLEPGKQWRVDEKRESALVFIGTWLPRELLEAGLDQCHADTDAVFRL